VKKTTGKARRLAKVLLAASLTVGGVVGSTAPAMAGGGGRAETSLVHAEAWTWTWGRTEGQSFAQHGCASAQSGWSVGTTNAWARCGLAGGNAWYALRG